MAKPVERSHSLIWYVKCIWDNLEAVKQDPCEVTESPELGSSPRAGTTVCLLCWEWPHTADGL